jgi:orotidine-5'-phosphate decarboxylase
MNQQQLIAQIQQKKNYLCVGLDTDLQKIPKHLQQQSEGLVAFNKAIIDATKDYCVSYKINTAFYESLGVKGWEIMEETLAYIPETHFTIADAKRGDIGNTAAQYAKTFFETLPFDAVTVAPYMGEDSVRPFLEYDNKTAIVLALTSNKGAADFQQLTFNSPEVTSSIAVPLYQKVLEKVASWGNEQNLMFVVGATRASDLDTIRTIVPNHFLLVPGVGTQGGSLADVSKYGLIHPNGGLLVNVSRAVIYADNGENYAEAAAQAAKAYHTEMNGYLV